MAGQGQRIGGGYVDIAADMSRFDNAMAALPKKAADKMDAAMKALQARAAQVKLDLKFAYNAGDLAAQQGLLPLQDQLRAKIEAVSAAAMRQAQALQNAARIDIAKSKVPVGPRDPAAVRLDDLGMSGKKAGEDVRQGGQNGAMGLLLLSQAIEDAQYGFSAIVNNIPGIVTGLGGSAGLAGALSLAAIAINTWVKNWEHAKEAFRGDGSWSRDIKNKFTEIKDAISSAAAALVNFNSAVTMTGRDYAFLMRGREAREEQKKALEKNIEAAEGAVNGVRGRAETERGQAFIEALGVFGGGRRLREELAAPLEAKALEGVRNRAKLAADKNSPQYDPAFDRDLEEQTAKMKVQDALNLRIVAAMRGDEGAIEGLMVASPGLAKARENTAQQAIEVQGRENTRAFMKKERERAKKRKEDADEFDMEANQVRGQENARLADALRGGEVGRRLLADPRMTDEMLEMDVRSSLGKSGMDANQIDAAAAGVAEKLRERIEKDVGTRALGRGIDDVEARKQLSREANKQAMEEKVRDAGGKTTGEFISGADAIYKQLQLNATAEDVRKNAGVQVAEKQLVEAQTTNKKLDEMKNAFAGVKPGPATYGPRR